MLRMLQGSGVENAHTGIQMMDEIFVRSGTRTTITKLYGLYIQKDVCSDGQTQNGAYDYVCDSATFARAGR